MQKKGYRILAILLCLLFVFSGCAKSEPVAATTYEPEPIVETEPEIVTVTEEQESIVETESENIPSDTSIAWIETKSIIEDTDGYKYEVSVKVSPWIYSSNEGILKDAWNEVGKGNEFPSLSNFRLDFRDNRYYSDWLDDFSEVNFGTRTGHFYNSTLEDVYYSVGQIEFKNITDGWDITEDNPRTIQYSLGAEVYSGNGESRTITYSILGRTIYSTSSVDRVGGVMVSPKMVKNTWGPAPFVLIAAEEFSPNYPNGGYYGIWKDSILYGRASMFGNCQTIEAIGDNTYIGIINKDGEYYIPE